MFTKKIIHIDMDCFYAAVEMRDNPRYCDIPIAVGGKSKRGVISTCNYIARQYGVRSALSNYKALQLCPDLTIVTGRMEVYKQVSKQIREIFSRYTDIVEPLSLDEAYLDVTHCPHHKGSATLIAKAIREDIYNELQLTASAGIAPNKFLAKIASDENKPNGQYVITPSQVTQFVEYLPLNKIPGIGPKTSAKLAKHHFYTCRDVRNSSVAVLEKIIGKQALSLYKKSFGEDERAVETSRERKSLAVETTLAEDLVDLASCIEVMDKLLTKLNNRFAKLADKHIDKLGVKVKFSDFNQTTVEQKAEKIDASIFTQLLSKAYQRGEGRSVRLVGISLGFKTHEALIKDEAQQLTLPY